MNFPSQGSSSRSRTWVVPTSRASLHAGASTWLRRWAGRGYLGYLGYLSTMVIFHSRVSNDQRVFRWEIQHFLLQRCSLQNEVYTVAFFAHYCRLPDGHHLVEVFFVEKTCVYLRKLNKTMNMSILFTGQ